MPLMTLDQVKDKLNLPSSYVDEDDPLSKVRDSAEQWVLELTGYVLADKAAKDVFSNLQVGRRVYLRYRPVENVTARARMALGNWVDVDLDVIDADKGLVMLTYGTPWPFQPPRPSWARWRDWAWEVVEISYTAKALNPVPADLSDAAAALAAYWYDTHRAGPAEQAKAGAVSQTYSDRPVPKAVEVVLSRYIREVVVCQ